MTAVGKILVFLNLLFSVATAGLIAMVFTTRASWKTEYDKVKSVALVAEAAYKSEKLAHDSDVRSVQSQLTSLEQTVKARDLTITNHVQRIDTLNKEKAALAEENAREVATHTALKNEVDAQKLERDLITKSLQKERGDKLLIQKDLNDAKLREVNNKIEADAQRARAERLLPRLEEVEKNLTAANNRLASYGAGGGTNSSIVNPPPTPAPRDVKGTIRRRHEWPDGNQPR